MSVAGFGNPLGPNRVRIDVMIARSNDTPTILEAGQMYYGFHLRFVTDNATEAGGGCEGCAARVAFVWSRAEVFSSPNTVNQCPDAASMLLEGISRRVTWNSGVTPIRNVTWGRLKTLYR